MDHKYFKDKISAYHDAGLNLEEQELLGQHIAECEECAAALAELEAFDRMIEKRSSFGADDYFEQNAQKIEQALGFGAQEKVVDVTPEKRSGLWWKATAVAASIAVLSFIALHEEEILEPVDSPQETMERLQDDAVPEQPLNEADLDAAGNSVGADEAESRPDIQPQVMEKPSRTVPPAGDETVVEDQSAIREDVADKQEPLAEGVTTPALDEPAPAARRIAPAEVKTQVAGEQNIARSTAEVEQPFTVISGNREANPERLAFWQEELEKYASAKSTSGRSFEKTLTEELSLKAKPKSLAESKEKSDTGTASPVTAGVSRELLTAHYMIASLTADSTEYLRSLGFIQNVSKTDSDEAEYAADLVKRLTGNSD